MYQLSYIKFEAEDFDLYLKIVSSDEVMRFITGKAPNLEESKKRYERILAVNNQQPLGGFFKVYERGNLVGLAKLENYEKELDTYEVGYLLLEEYWGMGYGTVVCKDLIQFARNNELASFVIALIHPENIASRTVLTKNGLESYFVGTENEVPTEKLRLKL